MVPSVFGCIPSGSRYANALNGLVHRVGPPFLDNYYHGYQYCTLFFVVVAMHAASELLYPFGTEVGDMLSPRIDDGGTGRISLRFGRLPYFGLSYQDIYVNYGI